MSQPERTPTGAGGSRAQRICLYATVALTGASVMVLELLGTRIIGPFYGASLYVWSSLIAVTMIALALGYYAGGWCADHLPQVRLAHLLAAAALGTFLIPLLSAPVLTATDALGMRVGAFSSALALFVLPLTCLGMTGPFVIKLATHELAGIGTSAGLVYAISTVGSVIGTLGLGFYLLPLFGTRSIIAGTGLLLLVLALGLGLLERRRIGRMQVMVLGLIGLGALVAFGAGTMVATRVASGFSVKDDAESIYGWVRVVDDERRNIRLLLSDASSIGAVNAGTGDTVLGYQQVLAQLPLLKRFATAATPGATRGEALLIGLGVGFVATRLKQQGIPTDTIEIDPEVARAAREHFGFQPTGRFIVGDGRYEIRNLGKRYDLIIHDCFTGGAEPTHLLTREMFVQLKGLLKEGGVLALNYVGFAHGEGSEALASVARTLAAVFPHQRAFVTLPNAEFSDYIFLVSTQPVEFTATNDTQQRVLDILKSIERTPPQAGGVLLTDDYNPLEHMQVRKAELYRKLFVDRVAPELLIR